MQQITARIFRSTHGMLNSITIGAERDKNFIAPFLKINRFVYKGK